MARILVRIPDDIEDAGKLTRSELCSRIFHTLKSDLEDELNVSDAYIVDFQDSDADDYLLGRFEPDRMLSEVQGWNRDIILSFAAAIDPLEKRAQKHGLTISEALAHNDELEFLKSDSQETYELRQSICAIDNYFTTYAQCMNYLPNACDFPYARTLLEPDELADIKAEPEKYAVISVYIK